MQCLIAFWVLWWRERSLFKEVVRKEIVGWVVPFTFFFL
jgi:hypothetical protein